MTDNFLGKLSTSCQCGQVIEIPSPRDHAILSTHDTSPFSALCNYHESGRTTLTKGLLTIVPFKQEIPWICATNVTACGTDLWPFIAFQQADCMGVTTSMHEKRPSDSETCEASWSVYGLIGKEWYSECYIRFLSGLELESKHQLRQALFEYAGAFDVFIYEWLRAYLNKKGFGDKNTKKILKQNNSIQARVTWLFALVTGFEFNPPILEAWQNHVQRKRNKIAHGLRIELDQNDIYNARVAVYDALRWIEDETAEHVFMNQEDYQRPR